MDSEWISLKSFQVSNVLSRVIHAFLNSVKGIYIYIIYYILKHVIA